MALPAAPCPYLSDRVRLPGGPDHRFDPRSRHSAFGRISGGRFKDAGRAWLLVHAHHLLAGAWRLVLERILHRRRCNGAPAASRNPEGCLGAPAAGWLIFAVSFVQHRRPGLPVIPMGLAAARNRVPCHLSREFKTCGAAVSMAAVPADLSLRRREVDQ